MNRGEFFFLAGCGPVCHELRVVGLVGKDGVLRHRGVRIGAQVLGRRKLSGPTYGVVVGLSGR